MAQINVSGLTFYYDGSFDSIFENVSFIIDTNWKLGFIGRNGKGKTTFLNLLLGKYKYQGSISSSVLFDYFPYNLADVFHGTQKYMDLNTIEIISKVKPEYELWKICRELELLQCDAGILYHSYGTLSGGERTKVMLAVLFSTENNFLLIDEPTNHLDLPSREIVAEYLKTKKGYILVSHDRWLLDSCVDHVLVLNRNSIEVERGNFSSWWENRQRRNQFEKTENEKRKHEIMKLEESAKKTSAWADKIERTKIGFDPIKEHDRFKDTRAYIGEKSRRMQQRRKNLERRQKSAIEEKSKLLKDMEEPVELKMFPRSHHKEVYINIKEFVLAYDMEHSVTGQSDIAGEARHTILKDFNMEVRRGERIVLQGKNGCGKSSVIKEILSAAGTNIPYNHVEGSNQMQDCQKTVTGIIEIAAGLKISYINQDTYFLQGNLDDYIEKTGASASLFKAVLRQLDFDAVQFYKKMEDYSEGQKKKVLITTSFLQQANLYIWDEPLNYIDVFSRMQIEDLILKYQPTMIIVEHDKSFAEKVGTKIISM